MYKEERINRLLEQIKQKEGGDFSYNAAAIHSNFKHAAENKSSLTIKILSVVGGVLATLAFLGFLFLTGMRSETSLLIVGISFLLGAVLLTKLYDRLIIETFSISAYAIGLWLISFGLLEMHINENVIVIFILIITLIVLFLIQSYMFSFLSVIAIVGSFFALVFINEFAIGIYLMVGILASILTYFTLNEAKIITINKKMAKLYNPIRIALVLSFFISLYAINKSFNRMFDFEEKHLNYYWLTSIVIIALLLFLISKIIKKIEISKPLSKAIIYGLSILIFASIFYVPSILGAMLLVLLSYYVNHKTGLALGVIALVYFVIRYYYDLSFTLLTKSIILFVSGILFLLLYVFTHKKLANHEKI